MHYKDLTIRGFRGIKELTLPELGRVNLLAGKNNTGKSSVLEALLLHSQNGSPSAIRRILSYREENTRNHTETADIAEPEGSFTLSTLFNGFPSLYDEIKPIHILASGKKNLMELKMLIDTGIETGSPSGIMLADDRIDKVFPGVEIIPVLRFDTEGSVENTYRIETFLRPSFGVRPRIEVRMPCQIVNSNNGQTTNDLGPLWDTIALTDRERDAIAALRLFDPDIQDFSMIGQMRSMKAMVRVKDIGHPIPLRSFGDGMNRMLSIALSVINAGGGILLIDDFENGLHYSVQPDAWRMVFNLAQDLDVQVFATTHSMDAIRSFAQVAISSEDSGVLIRLNRRGDVIMPITYTEDELEIAYNHAIEVR